MRIVHLGDLHFFRLGVWPWRLLSKRVLGQANLWFNRRRHFRPSLWPCFAARIKELAPDLILCSGDLSTTSLPGEFDDARVALHSLREVAPLRVVPGNHDRYTGPASRQRRFERAMGEWTGDAWPALWRHDGADVIGLDPTRPTWFHASGVLPQAQLEGLRDLLADPARQARVIVLCHYPLGTPPSQPAEPPHHALINREQLRAALAASPRRVLYLHGHIHRQWAWRPDPSGVVSVANAGAAMMIGPSAPFGQGFLEFEWGEDISMGRHRMVDLGVWRREALGSGS